MIIGEREVVSAWVRGRWRIAKTRNSQGTPHLLRNLFLQKTILRLLTVLM